MKINPATMEQRNLLEKVLDEMKIPYTLIPALPSILPTMTSNPILHVERPPTLFKVTPEFKLFLGAENIHKNGETTFEDILERIYIYARSNKLLSHDSLGFYLDDILQTLLKTYSKKIEWDSLYQHILLLLVKVK
jgi:hypothetical protein